MDCLYGMDILKSKIMRNAGTTPSHCATVWQLLAFHNRLYYYIIGNVINECTVRRIELCLRARLRFSKDGTVLVIVSICMICNNQLRIVFTKDIIKTSIIILLFSILATKKERQNLSFFMFLKYCLMPNVFWYIFFKFLKKDAKMY